MLKEFSGLFCVAPPARVFIRPLVALEGRILEADGKIEELRRVAGVELGLNAVHEVVEAGREAAEFWGSKRIPLAGFAVGLCDQSQILGDMPVRESDFTPFEGQLLGLTYFSSAARAASRVRQRATLWE